MARGPLHRVPLPVKATPLKHGPSLDRRTALLLGFALTGGMFFALSQVHSVSSERLAKAHTAGDIARAILGKSALVAATKDNHSISIHYDLGAWPLTRSSVRSSYLGNIIELVPLMFERIPETSIVEVVADNIFDTLQGHEVRQPAFSVTFSRAGAAKVPWPKVDKGDIVRLADRAWVTPSIGWQ